MWRVRRLADATNKSSDLQRATLVSRADYLACIGREFHAMAWVLARASKAIARTLAQIPDPSTAAVVVPDVPGLRTERLHEMFALALDCAYSSGLDVPAEDALDLWALAASLQVTGSAPELQGCTRAGWT